MSCPDTLSHALDQWLDYLCFEESCIKCRCLRSAGIFMIILTITYLMNPAYENSLLLAMKSDDLCFALYFL